MLNVYEISRESIQGVLDGSIKGTERDAIDAAIRQAMMDCKCQEITGMYRALSARDVADRMLRETLA